jgi:hypothetical protein
MQVIRHEKTDACGCGGKWKVLYEISSSGGGGYHLVRCPASDATTELLALVNSVGIWRLYHQSVDSDVWDEIANRDREVQKTPEEDWSPQT